MPAILTSVPDHYPNSTRSPVFRSIGISLPFSSRPPGPTAMISPSEGFSFAVSGMMIPPALFIFGVDALNHDAVVKRTKLHKYSPNCCVEFLRAHDGSWRGSQIWPAALSGKTDAILLFLALVN